tara:strand:+ start:160 stop:390 length:231 start_codon:yes stop_codon:yes gene_type:complete
VVNKLKIKNVIYENKNNFFKPFSDLIISRSIINNGMNAININGVVKLNGGQLKNNNTPDKKDKIIFLNIIKSQYIK